MLVHITIGYGQATINVTINVTTIKVSWEYMRDGCYILATGGQSKWSHTLLLGTARPLLM